MTSSQPLLGPFSERILPIRQKSVLIVDDNTENRTLLGRLMHYFGAPTDFAISGLEAIQKSLSSKYDVLLMDLQMPTLDGFQTAKILRGRGFKKKIVAISAIVDAKEKCLAMGFDDFLPKPVNRAQIADLIAKFSAE